MKQQSVACILYAIFFIFIFPYCVNGQDTGKLAQRFKDEASNKWKEYRLYAERLQGIVTHTRTIVKQGKRTTTRYRFEIKQNAKCKLVLEQALQDVSPKGAVRAYNPIYAFTLERRSSDKPWSIAGTEPQQEGNTHRIVQRTEEAAGFTQSLLRLFTDYLPDFVKEPTFRVVRATPIVREGVELVQIEFDNSHPWEDKPFCPIQRGTILLDPNRFWCLQAWDLDLRYSHNNTKNTANIDYAAPSARYPIPKRFSGEHVSLKVTPPRSMTVVKDFLFEEPASLPPDSEFTLTAFGLPEPYGVGPQGSRWYIWVAAAGFACLILGFFVRRHYQQRA